MLLPAQWTVAQALQFVAGQAFTHVVVEPTLSFTTSIPRPDALTRTEHSDPQAVLFNVFQLHEYTSTRALEAHANAESVADQAVVIDQGRVIGFFEVD